ncbi:MAG: 30S ribosome-binding factor RbfA [Acidobacteria bacterium]|nr:MAG: 30S ribosome-binding factor RbfA [Acidobacteriota bacterium]
MSNVPGRRQERLADQIQIEVAEMISAELKDPRIGFATVTRVDLTPDLTRARILVSVLGSPEAKEETLAGLASAAGYVRHELARRLRIRRTPELAFVLDHGPEEGQKLETLLQKIKKDQ